MVFCSTIIPTIGRPSLARAVQSVLEQELQGAEFEVIVVNDTGRPLPDENWLHHECVQVLTTQKRERCVARNAGAALANGQFLHFLDDDDWLLPDALSAFWQFVQLGETASWLQGTARLVDRTGGVLLKLRHTRSGNVFTPAMAGEWFPLQASLIKSTAFFEVGGFNTFAAGVEDIDLSRRLMLREELALLDQEVACVSMGIETSTTNKPEAQKLGQAVREDILEEPLAFQRMRQSAPDAFWQGRIIRIYLTSMLWNLRRIRGATAASRFFMAVKSLLLFSFNVFKASFWQSVLQPYQSIAFAQGFQEKAE